MAYRMSKKPIVRMPNTLRSSMREKETRYGKSKGMTPPGLKTHVIKF